MCEVNLLSGFKLITFRAQPCGPYFDVILSFVLTYNGLMVILAMDIMCFRFFVLCSVLDNAFIFPGHYSVGDLPYLVPSILQYWVVHATA